MEKAPRLRLILPVERPSIYPPRLPVRETAAEGMSRIGWGVTRGRGGVEGRPSLLTAPTDEDGAAGVDGDAGSGWGREEERDGRRPLSGADSGGPTPWNRSTSASPPGIALPTGRAEPIIFRGPPPCPPALASCLSQPVSSSSYLMALADPPSAGLQLPSNTSAACSPVSLFLLSSSSSRLLLPQ